MDHPGGELIRGAHVPGEDGQPTEDDELLSADRDFVRYPGLRWRDRLAA